MGHLRELITSDGGNSTRKQTTHFPTSSCCKTSTHLQLSDPVGVEFQCGFTIISNTECAVKPSISWLRFLLDGEVITSSSGGSD